jgi:DNA-binding transcriptional MocR family regulator
VTTFKYQQLATTLCQWMDTQHIRPGERLPSVRQLAKAHNVSLATVTQAYQWLESQGWVTIKGQSGHYRAALTVPLTNGQAASPTASTQTDHSTAHLQAVINPHAVITPISLSTADMGERIHEFFAAHRQTVEHKQGFVGFGTATPSAQLLPGAELYHSMKKITTVTYQTLVDYDLPPGYEPLRQQLSVLSRQWGPRVIPPEQLVLTNGAMEAFHICLRTLTEPGDCVVIEDPTYFGILQALASHGLRAISIPTHAVTGVDLTALRLSLQQYPVKACLLVPSFNNPLGSLMPVENRLQLAHLLAQHHIPLIENNVYGEIYFGPFAPPTVQSLYPDGEIYLCGSFTKTLAPGFRVGWIAPPASQVNRICQHKLLTSVGSSTLAQCALSQYLQGRRYQQHLGRLRQHCSQSVQFIRQCLYAYCPEGTVISDPQGGFVLWVKLPLGVNAHQLQYLAASAGLLIAPGIMFTPMFAAAQDFSDYIRINCALSTVTPAEKQDVQNKIEQLGKLITGLIRRLHTRK